MPVENCACGGNNIDRFYSLFTCDHANCAECHWTLNKCCNGCYSNSDSSNQDGCLNFYDINFKEVINSKIKSFGYCDNHKALGLIFHDGNKKLILNVEREVYDGLVELNKDLLFMFLEENISKETTQCIDIP